MSKNWKVEQWIELGGAYISKDPRYAQKVISYAIKSKPDCGIAWFNLGLAQHQQGKIEGAICCYRKALELEDENEQLKLHATTNLAQDLLLNREWEEGLKLYEQRFERGKSTLSQYKRLFGEPWKGWTDKRPVKELVVVGEQGYGDTLQFVRLIKVLQDKGLKTRYFGPEPLRILLERGTKLGPFPSMLSGEQCNNILWCPLMSLPHRLELNSNKIPLSEGYLTADQERINFWSQTLNRSRGKRLIALHWQGNPKFERSIYNRGRSMPLKSLAKLKELNDVEFLCVQKGKEAERIAQRSDLPWVKGQKEFTKTMDFQDTAAALSCCDLLISADSAVVHLAGALGIKTWVALSKVPEWRWGMTTKDCEWYKSVRLFRQHKANDWDSVINEMYNLL